MLKQSQNNGKLQIITGLGFIGFLLSIFLVQEHYATHEGPSWCDYGSIFSCSTVNKSVYSVIFGVPVASFGVAWNLILIVCSLLAKTGKRHYIIALVLWVIPGFGFIFYLIYGEYMLSAICPTCTIIHIFTVIVSYLTWKIYTSLSNQNFTSDIINCLFATKYWILSAIILHLAIIYYYNVIEKPDFGELAQCLTSKGVKMYGNQNNQMTQTQIEKLGKIMTLEKYQWLYQRNIK